MKSLVLVLCLLMLLLLHSFVIRVSIPQPDLSRSILTNQMVEQVGAISETLQKMNWLSKTHFVFVLEILKLMILFDLQLGSLHWVVL